MLATIPAVLMNFLDITADTQLFCFFGIMGLGLITYPFLSLEQGSSTFFEMVQP